MLMSTELASHGKLLWKTLICSYYNDPSDKSQEDVKAITKRSKGDFPDGSNLKLKWIKKN
jgi:hypothetical protein